MPLMISTGIASLFPEITERNHSSNSLLDHVIIPNELLRQVNTRNEVADMYFSDQEAVLIQFAHV